MVPLVRGADVIAQAQAGTGKTGAFAIGVLQRVDAKKRGCQVSSVPCGVVCAVLRGLCDGACLRWCVQALILSPTLELASQTHAVVSALAKHTGITVRALVKGTSIGEDARALRGGGVGVVVGTPGRVYDCMQRGMLGMDDVAVVVLDEADKLLSCGFKEQMQEVFRCLPSACQVALFSATFGEETLALSEEFLREPVRILIEPEELSMTGIHHYFLEVPSSGSGSGSSSSSARKLDAVCDLYEALTITQAVIFVNHRRDVEWLAEAMREREFPVSALHGELEPSERNYIMQEFRSGMSRVLIATDAIARGIDVQQVSLVINFELPRQHELYIHRVGRSGRYGRSGVAINLLAAREFGSMEFISRHYGVEVLELPGDVTAVNAVLMQKQA